ncbi:TetR family transcriptional regulator [Novosphingobium kunmingense]|uniref:TetR family transcriptional regulator n=1 Tax=Novosphingobium kunmingense TaxID=1211806 RepID=A0A2N0HJZ6_9SPHN|nr:TetR/AcrR family transcriptional regulator [Novosphingobium kunmingense]PKB19205.1 TetR family transcriptional regulator [Novosphingobium kunmingense]
MRTRDRIVAAARALFNEQGFGAVTTAALAAQCGISEGNLWYHFKTKRDLMEAVADQFAETIDARLLLRPDPDGDGIADYARLIGALMEEFRLFRFLYRDQAAYGEHAPVIGQRAPEWIEATFAQIEAHLARLVDEGQLAWPRAGLRDLSINATIILRYGLEHYRELGEPTGTGTGAVRRTMERHLTLFQHALEPAAARRLRTALAEIAEIPIAA